MLAVDTQVPPLEMRLQRYLQRLAPRAPMAPSRPWELATPLSHGKMTLPPLTVRLRSHCPYPGNHVYLDSYVNIVLNLLLLFNNWGRDGASVDTNEKVKSLINLG